MVVDVFNATVGLAKGISSIIGGDGFIPSPRTPTREEVMLGLSIATGLVFTAFAAKAAGERHGPAIAQRVFEEITDVM